MDGGREYDVEVTYRVSVMAEDDSEARVRAQEALDARVVYEWAETRVVNVRDVDEEASAGDVGEVEVVRREVSE